MAPPDLRVLIVAENVGSHGGEPALPFQYFRLMRSRGIEAWLVTHARCRAQLEAALPQEMERIHFVPDTLAQKILWQIGRPLPLTMSRFTTGTLLHLITQSKQRPVVRRLVPQHSIDVVHEPMPISPREPSMMYGVGAPVVIGPLVGAMDYPPAFRHKEGRLTRLVVSLGRVTANRLNRLIPGKLLATTLIVANQRTKAALPAGFRGQVEQMWESGVDTSVWQPPEVGFTQKGPPIRFACMGRLIALKAIDILLEAFKVVAEQVDCTLEIVGDGPDRRNLESMAETLGVSARVSFPGWLSPGQAVTRLQKADVFVFPSLHDAGATVVAEAMAVGLPVVTTNWGGQADFVNEQCGIRVDPTSPQSLASGLANAMLALARSCDLRLRMGRSGRQRAVDLLDWNAKVNRMLRIYQDTIARAKIASERVPGLSLAELSSSST